VQTDRSIPNNKQDIIIRNNEKEYHLDDQVKKTEMGRTYSTCGGGKMHAGL
jgi:hypothetical protein